MGGIFSMANIQSLVLDYIYTDEQSGRFGRLPRNPGGAAQCLRRRNAGEELSTGKRGS